MYHVMNNGRALVLSLLLLFAFLLAPGCAAESGVTPTEITVMLINQTDLQLDPHLYVSAAELNDADLFTVGQMYANFSGNGVIDPNTTVTLKFDCDNLKAIGSYLASFAILEPIPKAGKSVESPVIEIDGKENNPACGQVLTIRFSVDDMGAYHTNWQVTDTVNE